MSQWLIEYSIRFKIVFIFLNIFMFIFNYMMLNPLKKQKDFYFDIERVLFTIHMIVASSKRSF
jgi:hypothetical protein